MITAFAVLAALGAATPAAAPDTSEFQQGVEYRIEARLDESTDVLHGRARLRYTNNSPHTLDTLYVHQHLNAFRPNSAWAQRDLENGNRTFQDLGPDEHAYERFTAVVVDDEPVTPVYPGAPDSTVAAIPLPEPLGPGETVTVRMDWDARLSTEPRRQGRRGRHYDFAQWYPRVAVYEADGWKYNPLIRQGEFYGEFATYDVTLDVAADQVIGATGVPVEGDPGWADAAAPGTGDIRYARDAFGTPAAERLGFLSGAPDDGRKRVRWRAENVHHFAWSASPDYIYEGGEWKDVRIHVLYQPGDTAWDEGVAVERTATALAWMDTLFGDYPYPQLTNVHRIEDGGTEFPMLIMDGSASQGLIVHETAHQYAHGLLASNEWLEAWLDEGMASFVTNWFMESRGAEDVWARTLDNLARFERATDTQPVSTHAAEFADYRMYGVMSYTKGSSVLYMLREYLGADVMRQVLRTYYDRHKFSHVTEADLKNVAEEVSGRELDWFFEQWLHTTHTLDYRVAGVETEEVGDGAWRTRVRVTRTGEAWMPVTVRVGDVTKSLDGRGREQVVEITTRDRPTEVVLDPDHEILDTDRSNNRRTL